MINNELFEVACKLPPIDKRFTYNEQEYDLVFDSFRSKMMWNAHFYLYMLIGLVLLLFYFILVEIKAGSTTFLIILVIITFAKEFFPLKRIRNNYRRRLYESGAVQFMKVI